MKCLLLLSGLFLFSLGAAELRTKPFTPAQGDAERFKQLVESSAIGSPAGQLERLKAELNSAKPKATPPVSLLSAQLTGKRVESARSGNLNSIAFSDAAGKKLQVLVWNSGSIRDYAEIVIDDAERYFGTGRVLMKRKLLSTEEENAQPVEDGGLFTVLDGTLSFGTTLPPGSAALLELVPFDGQNAAELEAAKKAEEKKQEEFLLPEGAENIFADPDFRRQNRDGMNGEVYVRFAGGLKKAPEEGIVIDSEHFLSLRLLRVQGNGRFYAGFEVRGTEDHEVTLSIQFMQRQKHLATRKLTGKAQAAWGTVLESFPIPAGTTHVNCTLEGGPAEVKGLFFYR